MSNNINSEPQRPTTKILGVGGGGCYAISHLFNNPVEGVELICADTDIINLSRSEAHTKLHFGDSIANGYREHDLKTAYQAAQVQCDSITKLLADANMVVIVSCLGGSAGSGIASFVAEVAKELGVLTFAFVTMPFTYEGTARLQIANEGLDELKKLVDSYLVIPNDRLLQLLPEKMSLKDKFIEVDKTFREVVGCLVSPLNQLDQLLRKSGVASIGTGAASGEDNLEEALELAIAAPLLEVIQIDQVNGLLVNIYAVVELSRTEITWVEEALNNFGIINAPIIIVNTTVPQMDCEVKITILATGIRM